jgi:hypothetical protein
MMPSSASTRKGQAQNVAHLHSHQLPHLPPAQPRPKLRRHRPQAAPGRSRWGGFGRGLAGAGARQPQPEKRGGQQQHRQPYPTPQQPVLQQKAAREVY